MGLQVQIHILPFSLKRTLSKEVDLCNTCFTSCCSFFPSFPSLSGKAQNSWQYQEQQKGTAFGPVETFPPHCYKHTLEPFSETGLVFSDNHQVKSIDCSLKNLTYPIKEWRILCLSGFFSWSGCLDPFTGLAIQALPLSAHLPQHSTVFSFSEFGQPATSSLWQPVSTHPSHSWHILCVSISACQEV